MCRWLAYSGSPVLLEELLYAPENSLVMQSKHAKLGATAVNGDGFGIGWYGNTSTPGLFLSTEPHVERPQPAGTVRADHRRPGVRARAGLHGRRGAAVELPPVPPPELVVDAQRADREVPAGAARADAGDRPRAVPADRGVDGLGDHVLPGDQLRDGAGPMRPGWRAWSSSSRTSAGARASSTRSR